MRLGLWAVLVGAVSACTLSFPDVPDAPDEAGGQVVGRAVLPNDFEAARVALGQAVLSGGAEAPLRAAIGDDGTFAFDGVPAGTYALTVELRGFAGGTAPVEVVEGEVNDVGDIPLRVTAVGWAIGTVQRLRWTSSSSPS